MPKLAIYVLGFGLGALTVNLGHALWLHSEDYAVATVAMAVITVLGVAVSEAVVRDLKD